MENYMQYANEEAELLQFPSQIYKHIFAYADSLVVRAAVELRIADIIQSHGEPMKLSDIASKLESTNPNVQCLARLLRFLVRKKLFTIDTNDKDGEALYGLTPAALMLTHDFELSLAKMVLTFTHPTIMAPWYKISQAIKEGGTPFDKTHGQSFWEKGAKDPEFNDMFNAGMASFTTPSLLPIMKGYEHEFRKLEGTIVDVGGGIGRAVAAIVEAHPHLIGINFDQPHVVATAPQYPGVTHVAGNMFEDIQQANTILIKDVLHDWADENCVKILRNCHKAISASKGKVIIIDEVLRPDENGLLDDVAFSLDIWLMADCVGGKGRTEDEWTKLLQESGFTKHNIVPVPYVSSFSIIEAFI